MPAVSKVRPFHSFAGLFKMLPGVNFVLASRKLREVARKVDFFTDSFMFADLIRWTMIVRVLRIPSTDSYPKARSLKKMWSWWEKYKSMKN